MKRIIGQIFWLTLLFVFAVGPEVRAQSSNGKRIELEFRNERLPQAFKKLEKATNYKIMFIYDDVNQFRVNGKVTAHSIEEAMRRIIGNHPLEFTIDKQYVNVTLKRRAQTTVVERESDRDFPLKGKVVDENGVSLPGVNIRIQGTTRGTITDANGHYTMNVGKHNVLVFSFIGYKDEVVVIKDNKKTLNVEMTPSTQSIDEVQVVAFGTQKKESVVSAITTVRPGDLKVASSDLTTSFAGRIPGMIAWQTGGLPGALTESEMQTKFYIRGITSFQSGANTDPLILLDGVESSKLDLSRLNVEDIESFSVLKDASATAMYGARGANGVILVTTKKGEEGSVYTTFRYESILTQPTEDIDVVDPITYMQMYNQAQLNRIPDATPLYSVERINRTASGKYPSWLYPANDWYKQLFESFSWNHHAGVNIRGGSSKVQYYAAFNYNRDEGMLKTDKLNDFDCNILNNTFQFRTNLNIDLKAGIKLQLNSVTTLDKYHGPLQDQTQAYALAFNASPVDFAPTYPADDQYNWPHILFGTTQSQKTNPYLLIQQGYMDRTRYNTQNRVEFQHNLSSLVKGLEYRLAASLVQTGYYYSSFYTKPYMYALKSYDFETGKHVLTAINEDSSDRTLEVDENASTTDTRLTLTGTLMHTAAWGGPDKNRHQTAVTAVVQAQDRTFTPISDVLNGQPQRNLTFSARASYGFMDRYFAEGSFGYNGSERFEESNRFGFFPAVGLAWVASSEPWMQKASSWLHYLKFRLSYGKVGNDGIISTPRFVFLPTIGRGGMYQDTHANGSDPFYRKKISAYADPTIQWEIAEQSNLGVELKLFNGVFEMQADIYQEIRHNIISNRLTVPISVGLETFPLANIGKTRSRGVDLSAKIQKMFSNDCWLILNGTFTYNKVTYKEIDEPVDKPTWQLKKGHEISQPIGYIAEGLFKDQADIDNSPRQDGDVMPGDIKYRDINNDGVIDVNDATYIGYPETPRIIYGFSGYFTYKAFEFNFAFQGSGQRSFFINSSSISPFVDDHAMLTAIYEDHWSEDNQSERPFWPRLSTYNISRHNPEEAWGSSEDINVETRKSTYFMRECYFLRCTSLELAYNMPSRIINRWGLKNLKIYGRVNNAFLLTNFDLWDVELGTNGFNYPIQRTYSLGFNLSF